MRTPCRLLLLLSTTCLGACGYSFGTELSQEGIHTVAVRVVDNETFRHRLEIRLTRQINAELVNLTDLVPAAESHADAILTVEIVDAAERTLVIGDRVDPVKEGAFAMVIRSQLVARDDGRSLTDREITDQKEFRVPMGETLETATAEMITDMARKIVLSLETSF